MWGLSLEELEAVPALVRRGWTIILVEKCETCISIDIVAASPRVASVYTIQYNSLQFLSFGASFVMFCPLLRHFLRQNHGKAGGATGSTSSIL